MLLLAGCGLIDNDQKWMLTNPTDQAIYVKIDDQGYTLEPEGAINIDLKVGKHTMALPNGETVNFKVFKNSSGGIINPTRSAHVIYTMIYAVEGAFDSFRPATTELLIDGILFEDAIQTTDDMFIDNGRYRCTYYVGEPFPAEITMYDKDAKGNMKSKYFTVKEFVNFYAESTGEKVDELERPDGNETQITFNTNIQIPVPTFENKERQEHALKIVDIINGYMNADDSSDQEKYLKEYHDAVIAFIPMQDWNNASDSEKYNEFIHQAGSSIGIGICQIK